MGRDRHQDGDSSAPEAPDDGGSGAHLLAAGHGAVPAEVVFGGAYPRGAMHLSIARRPGVGWVAAVFDGERRELCRPRSLPYPSRSAPLLRVQHSAVAARDGLSAEELRLIYGELARVAASSAQLWVSLPGCAACTSTGHADAVDEVLAACLPRFELVRVLRPARGKGGALWLRARGMPEPSREASGEEGMPVVVGQPCAQVAFRHRGHPDLTGAVRDFGWIPDGTVHEIVADAVLERVRTAVVPDLLAEWYRVLQERGSLLVRAPSLRWTAREFSIGHVDDLQMVSRLCHLQADPSSSRTAYALDDLVQVIADAGFELEDAGEAAWVCIHARRGGPTSADELNEWQRWIRGFDQGIYHRWCRRSCGPSINVDVLGGRMTVNPVSVVAWGTSIFCDPLRLPVETGSVGVVYNRYDMSRVRAEAVGALLESWARGLLDDGVVVLSVLDNRHTDARSSPSELASIASRVPGLALTEYGMHPNDFSGYLVLSRRRGRG
jgi:hypothetical protein